MNSNPFKAWLAKQGCTFETRKLIYPVTLSDDEGTTLVEFPDVGSMRFPVVDLLNQLGFDNI